MLFKIFQLENKVVPTFHVDADRLDVKAAAFRNFNSAVRMSLFLEPGYRAVSERH